MSDPRPSRVLVAKNIHGTAIALQWRGRQAHDAVEASPTQWLEDLGLDQTEAPWGLSVWEGVWPGGLNELAQGGYRVLRESEWSALRAGQLVFGEGPEQSEAEWVATRRGRSDEDSE